MIRFDNNSGIHITGEYRSPQILLFVASTLLFMTLVAKLIKFDSL